ncbi:hypothetical protein MKW92_035457, partial [Papaver armeniacum]
AKFKEITKILGYKWKIVTEEKKKPYEEKYQAYREAYLQIVGKEKCENEAMKLLEEDQKQKKMQCSCLNSICRSSKKVQQKSKMARKRSKEHWKERDPLKPKRPLTKFFLFSKEVRSNHADNKNVLEKMSEEQKWPYEEIMKKQKE